MKSATRSPGFTPANASTAPGLRSASRATCCGGRAGSALAAGFTIGETRLFLSGFSEQTPPAARWRALAERKLKEVDALMDRAQRMKLLLETSFQCRCPRLEDCEKFLRSANRKQAGSC